MSATTHGFGPGWPRQAYLDALAAGEMTGWWDDNGLPAPWPEDFCDPYAGWQPEGGEHPTTDINPDQPF